MWPFKWRGRYRRPSVVGPYYNTKLWRRFYHRWPQAMKRTTTSSAFAQICSCFARSSNATPSESWVLSLSLPTLELIIKTSRFSRPALPWISQVIGFIRWLDFFLFKQYLNDSTTRYVHKKFEKRERWAHECLGTIKQAKFTFGIKSRTSRFRLK